MLESQVDEIMILIDENKDGEIQYDELLDNIGEINNILMRNAYGDIIDDDG